MTRTEKDHFVKYARGLSDEELEQMYYDIVFSTLGSEAEEMYDRGYDMVDIMEQEKYERDLSVKSGILEGLCMERGIKLWEEADGNDA
jgi:hypothetical protein